MSAPYNASLDPGDFSRSGASKIELDRPVTLTIAGRRVDLPVRGKLDVTVRVTGEIRTTVIPAIHVDGVKNRITGDWIIPPVDVPEKRVLAPGAFPSIRAEVSRTVSVDVDAARALFEALEPADALRAAATVADELHAVYQQGLAATFEELLGKVRLDRFPYHELLGPLASELAGLVRSALTGGWTALVNELRDKLRGDLVRARDELIAVAQSEWERSGPLAERALALLVLAGRSLGDLLAAARTQILDDLRAGRSFVERAVWLFNRFLQGGVAGAIAVVVEVIVAARDRWAEKAPEIQDLLGRLAATLGARKGQTFAAVIAAVLRAREISVATHARLLGDLVELAGRAAGGWKEIAPLLGNVLAAAERAGVDVGAVLTPIFETIRLHKSELFELLKHLGNDELLKKTCQFLSSRWAQVSRAFIDAAGEIKLIVDLIAGLADQHPPQLRAGLDKVKALLTAAQRLGDDLAAQRTRFLGAAALDGVRALVDDPVGWVQREAARRGVAPDHALRGFVLQSNPAAAMSLDSVSALESFLHALDAPAIAVSDAGAWIREMVKMIDDIFWAGGVPDAQPYTFEVGYRSFMSGRMLATGATTVLGDPMITRAAGEIADFMGAALVDHATDIALVDVRAKKGKMHCPEPTQSSMAALIDEGGWDVRVALPIALPAPLIGTFAVAYLADLSVLDMRYAMPYGKVGNYKVVDLDGDGFVREWEIEEVRKAAGGAARFDPRLDVDGDGEISAGDVSLAEEQRDLYVNGLMYRRLTAPLTVRGSIDENNWWWCAVASCKDESIPGKIERLGVLYVIEESYALPIRALVYPLRIHREVRVFGDEFPEITPLGIWTPPVSPSIRWDFVARLGHGGRDLQLYFTSEPLNLMSRVWTFKASVYLRGVLTGAVLGPVILEGLGLAGKVDGRLIVMYECGSPLAQVLLEWHKRVVDAATAARREALRAAKDPIKYFMALAEEMFDRAKIGPLYRALKRLNAPLYDLLFDWTDADGSIRGSLAWVRETELRDWRPGLTFAELDAWIAGWAAEPSGTGPGATVVPDAAIGAARTGLANAVARLRASASDPAHAAGVIRDFILRELALRADAELARIKTIARFDHERPLLVAAYSQLVRDPTATVVTIPGAGEFDVVDVPAIAPGELVPELADGQAVPVPLLHAVLRIGPSAQLWTAPAHNLGWRITDLRENSVVTVEGPRVLVRRGAVDATGKAGDWWLYVRTGGGQYGWLLGGTGVASDDDAWVPLETVTIPLPDGRRALDAETLAKMVIALANSPDGRDRRPNLLDYRPKVLNPVDDLGYLASGPQRLVPAFRDLLRQRLFAGAEHAFAGDPEAPRKLFDRMSRDEQAAFWSQFAADIKSQFYNPRILAALMPALTALLHGDLGAAVRTISTVLGRMRPSSEAELLLAADQAAPPLLEILKILFDVLETVVGAAVKLKDAAQEAKAVKDKVDATKDKAKATSKPTEASIAADAKVLSAESRIRSRWDEFVDRVKDQKGQALKDSDAQLGIRLATEKARLELPDFIARFVPEQELGREAEIADQKWKEVAGEHYAATRDLSDKERQRYMVEARWKEDERVSAEEIARYECLSPAERDAFMEQQEARQAAGEEPGDPSHFRYTQIDLFPPKAEGAVEEGDVSASAGTGHLGHAEVTIRTTTEDGTQIDVHGEAAGSQSGPGEDSHGHLEGSVGMKDARGNFGKVTYEANLQQETSDGFGSSESTYGTVTASGSAGDEDTQVRGSATVVGFRSNDDGSTLGEVGMSGGMTHGGLSVDGSATASLFSSESGKDSYVNLATTAKLTCAGATITGSAQGSALTWDDGTLTLGPGSAGGSFGYGEKPKGGKQLWEKKLSMAFGDDTLSITYSCEEGAGGGAGTEVGSGTTANATGSVRIYGYALKIPVTTLLSFTDGGAVFLRFALRTLSHLCDSVDALAAWIQSDVRAPGSRLLDPERLVPLVFAAFAFIEALRDIAGDHPDFVVKVLEQVNAAVQLDANGAVTAGVSVGGELNETVTLKGAIKLSTIVAPLLDLLDGGRAKVDEVASAAERIVPEVKVEVGDHTIVKGAYFPYGFEVHSRGRIGLAKVCIPPGSSFREGARELWGWIAGMAEAFKAQRVVKVGPGDPDPRPTAQLRSILDKLDRAVLGRLMPVLENPTDPTAWMSSAPSVSSVVSRLQGKPGAIESSAPAVSDQIAAAYQMLKDTGVFGVPLQPGRLLVAQPLAQGFMQIEIYLSDADKTKVDRWSSPAFEGGLPPPVPPEPSVELSAYRLRLPSAPVRVGWNTWTDPYGEHRKVTGIIAGFDSDSAARAFAAARDPAFVDGALRDRTFPREGKFWAWLETGMELLLEGASCPLPRLELDGSELTLIFTAAPFEGPQRSGSPLLVGGNLLRRETIWRRVLVTRATRTDYLTLLGQLEANAGIQRGNLVEDFINSL